MVDFIQIEQICLMWKVITLRSIELIYLDKNKNKARIARIEINKPRKSS